MVLIFIALLSVILLYPVIFVFMGSFMGSSEVEGYLAPILTQSDSYVSWHFFPSIPTLRFYIEILLDTPEFFVMFWNSVKTAVAVVMGQLLIGIPAAWVFAQYEFKCKKVLFHFYVLLLVIPFIVLMLPEYYVLDRMNLLDSLWSVILPGIFSTMPVIIVYPYFKKISKILLESARLEGCNEFQIFFYVGIPLAKPAIITTSLLNFVEYWSILEQPLVFIKDKSKWNLPLFLSTIKLDNAGVAFVSAVISLIPAILFFWLFHEDLERGMIVTITNE